MLLKLFFSNTHYFTLRCNIFTGGGGKIFETGSENPYVTSLQLLLATTKENNELARMTSPVTPQASFIL